MAKRRGYKFVIIGLLFGIAIGFGIRELKRQIGLALIEMLESEAYSSSGCHFVADSIDVSLLRERAVAVSPRVMCADVPHLQFKRIIADFSLKRIQQHIVDLRLTLIDGTTLGFGADSTTFKFIDSLAAPIAPERDTADRYRVKLQRLDVAGLQGSDTVAGHRVVALGADLKMVRTPANNFSLLPTVKAVTVESGSRTVAIEGISAALDLTDEKIALREIRARMGPTVATGELTLANDSTSKLDGKFIISGKIAQFTDAAAGSFSLPITLSGTSSSPVVHGSLSTSNLAIDRFLATEQLTAAFNTDNNGEYSISQLNVGFLPGKFSVASPIIFSTNGNSGKATVDLVAPLSGRVSLDVTGNLASPALRIAGNAATADGASVQTALTVSNLLATPEISGTGAGTFPGLPKLSLTIQRISQGVARVLLTGADNSIAGTANINLESGSGDLDLTVASSLIAQRVPCGALDASAKYRWMNFAPKLGSGTVKLNAFAGGCNLSATKLRNPVELAVTNGILQVKNLSILSLGKPFGVDGSVGFESGFDLNVDGVIDMTTIRGLIPSVDEISGTGAGKIFVSGPINSPRISGNLEVMDLRVEQAKSGIEISKVNGPIFIADNLLTLKELTGIFNGGAVTINGTVNLTDIAQSSAHISAKRFAFEPNNNLSVLASGDILITQVLGEPRLSGNLNIDSADFSDEIKLSEVLKIIERAIVSQRVQSANSALPPVKIEIAVTGNRNLFVNTNLGAVELAADLVISGTLRDPLIRGDVTVRSGWLGFQNRRFEINAGRLIFTPPDLVPSLELTAETILPARTGENVLVILTGRGRVSSPVFSLSSDQPITERELLALVSAGGSFSSRTRANTLGSRYEGESTPLLEELAKLHLRSFFTKLVDVDSLSISPLFNPRSGLIEPALVAEKLLADSLTLVGESTLSGVEGISRARLQLDLSDNLAVGALAEDDPTRSGVPTELQMTYTPLSRHARRVDVTFTGNKRISDRAILTALRLSSTSFVTPQDIIALEAALKEFYSGAGYPSVAAKISCTEFVDTCTAIEISIDEGAPRLVSKLEVSGSGLPVSIPARTRKLLTEVPARQLASEAFKIARVKSVVNALRSEGFIAARVEAEYLCPATNEDCAMRLGIEAGDPISFTFTGNTLFTASDFLGAIRLFERSQPFGNNTIAVLGATIERMYRERGYLFATVSYEKHVAASDVRRTIYEFSIDEGLKVSVSAVSFEGISDELQRELLEGISTEQRENLLSPSVPLQEEIEENAFVLTSKLNDLGFLSASVSGDITPIGDSNKANIVYRIETGRRSERVIPQIINWPTEISLPSSVTSATFASELPKRGDLAVQVLRDAGYLNAAVSQQTMGNTSGAELTSTAPEAIFVESGDRTSIRSISVTGNPTIASSVILEAIRLRVGDPMSQELLNQARSRLLRLGLFARVASSTTKSGDVTFEVLERSPTSVEVGAGLNSEFGFHLFGEAADREIFGDGRQIALRLDGYYDASQNSVSKGTASGQFRVPLIFNSNLGLSEDIRFQRFDQATLPFDLDRWSLASFLSGENESWTYSFGHTFITDRLDNVERDAVLSKFDTGSVRLGTLSGTITYDNRDAPLNPQSGFLLSLDSKISSPIFGSEANFFELSPRFSWATELQTSWGVAYQLRLGVGEPFGSTSEIPITQRYFTGGRTSVRGYKENSLGPRGEQGAVQGGRYLGVQNVELRYKPVQAVAILGFVDSGTVFLDSPSINELRHSTGLGIRYLSPVGPIGFDVGFPIARRHDEDVYRIHFSIGTIF